MAVLRASLAQIPIVLVSATPSLETVVNVARSRYERVALPRRHAAAELPAVRLVDLRRERIERGRFLAPPLVAELAATFEAGEQALLFLNRRGYAPLTLCRACGHRFQCPSCTAWLVEHRFTGRLLCHHCGHAEAVPACCPECLAAGALVPWRPSRTRRAQGAGADPNLHARPAGHEGAGRRRPRPISRGRGRGAAPCGAAALWPAGRADRQRRGRGNLRFHRPRPLPRRAAATR